VKKQKVVRLNDPRRRLAVDAILLYAELNNIWGPDRFEKRELVVRQHFRGLQVPEDVIRAMSREANFHMSDPEGGQKFKERYVECFTNLEIAEAR
jgi:hypothetical protein